MKDSAAILERNGAPGAAVLGADPERFQHVEQAWRSSWLSSAVSLVFCGCGDWSVERRGSLRGSMSPTQRARAESSSRSSKSCCSAWFNAKLSCSSFCVEFGSSTVRRSLCER